MQHNWRTRVAILGGGISGQAMQRALTDRGATVELLSRSTGVDVLSDDLPTRLAPYDVVIEATGIFTTSKAKATEFFTRSTTAVAAATRASGARHILLSIVNCDAPQVQGYGYFAGKAAQERTARTVSEHLSIIRTTQWFEFAEQNLQRMKAGPVSFVPIMTVQPVALAAVAEVVADVAVGRRTDQTIELAGPDVMSLWEMTKHLPNTNRVLVPLPLPGRWGRALRQGECLPAPKTEVIGPSFTQWLQSQSIGS